MSQPRKHYTPQQKVAILKRYLVDKVPLSDLCDEYGIHPTMLYNWQKRFFEQGATVFERPGPTPRRADDGKDRKIASLEEKLQLKKEVVAELMQEHVKPTRASPATRAPASVHSQGGASPPQASALRPVTKCNCGAAKRRGEQHEVNDQSVG